MQQFENQPKPRTMLQLTSTSSDEAHVDYCTHQRVNIPAIVVQWSGDNEIVNIIKEFTDMELEVSLGVHNCISLSSPLIVDGKVSTCARIGVLRVNIGEYLVILYPQARYKNQLIKLTSEQGNAFLVNNYG